MVVKTECGSVELVGMRGFRVQSLGFYISWPYAVWDSVANEESSLCA